MTQRLVPSALALLLAAAPHAGAQALGFTAVEAEVDFGQKLRDWDGFGFNYVEAAQTRDYGEYAQEYGGWSILRDADRKRIVDLVFGADGLKVGLVKMFLDPFHQNAAGEPFDHETTTSNMRAFVRAGLEKTRADGRDFTIITTLYGPPAYKEMHGNIYTAKVNGIIPWAGIQRPPHWLEGDPNPGSAFYVSEEGELEVRRGYYVYKQISRAGQPGMAVAWTRAMDSEIAVMGFTSNGTANPDAAIVVNTGEEARQIQLKATSFQAFRTTDDDEDKFADAGRFAVSDGAIVYEAPAGSVTTFFGAE